jgi:hypothetical protein
MAKVIEFYIPTRFQKKVAWVPPQERGNVPICLSQRLLQQLLRRLDASD